MSAQGTLFSNLVMYFITLTTALTLHRHGLLTSKLPGRLLSTDIDRERKRPRCGAADGSPALVYMSILGWNTQFIATCFSRTAADLVVLDVKTARLVVQVAALTGLTFATSCISLRS
jgi:hypothetical protein